MPLLRAPWVFLAVALAGCRTAPEPRLESFRAALLAQEVQAVEQTFHDVTLREVLQVKVPPGTRASRVRVTVLLGKQVLVDSEEPADAVADETGVLTVSWVRKVPYASDLGQMEALDHRQTLPLLVRGVLTLAHEEDTRTLEFSQAKDLRAPRLLVPNLKDVSAARYDNGEVNLHFYLGIFNPNPFPVRLRGVHTVLEVAGEKVGESTVGQAEVVAASSTASFELEQFLDASSEELNQRLFKMSSIPYRLEGELSSEEYHQPFELKGSLRLERGR